VLQDLKPSELEKCKQILLAVSTGYYKRLKASAKAWVKKPEFEAFLERSNPEDLAKVLRRLTIIMQTKVYLLWRNPHLS